MTGANVIAVMENHFRRFNKPLELKEFQKRIITNANHFLLATLRVRLVENQILDNLKFNEDIDYGIAYVLFNSVKNAIVEHMLMCKLKKENINLPSYTFDQFLLAYAKDNFPESEFDDEIEIGVEAGNPDFNFIEAEIEYFKDNLSSDEEEDTYDEILDEDLSFEEVCLDFVKKIKPRNKKMTSIEKEKYSDFVGTNFHYVHKICETMCVLCADSMTNGVCHITTTCLVSVCLKCMVEINVKPNPIENIFNVISDRIDVKMKMPILYKVGPDQKRSFIGGIKLNRVEKSKMTYNKFKRYQNISKNNESNEQFVENREIRKKKPTKKILESKKQDEEFVGKQKEIIKKTPTKRNTSEMTGNANKRRVTFADE